MDSALITADQRVEAIQRGWGSYKVDWSLRLHRLGFSMISHLHPLDAGIRGTRLGDATIADAWPHCPFIALKKLPPPANYQGRDREDYQAGIWVRWHAACELVEQTDDWVVFICPAQALKVDCGLWDLGPVSSSQPKVDNPPARMEDALEVCKGPLRLRRDAEYLRKNLQPVYPGGPDWQSLMDQGRPTAEAVFASLFSEKELGATEGFTDLVGQARTGLIYTLALAVQSVRKLRQWWQDPAPRSLLPADLRQALEQDPLLWPNHRLAAELPRLFP